MSEEMREFLDNVERMKRGKMDIIDEDMPDVEKRLKLGDKKVKISRYNDLKTVKYTIYFFFGCGCLIMLYLIHNIK